MQCSKLQCVPHAKLYSQTHAQPESFKSVQIKSTEEKFKCFLLQEYVAQERTTWNSKKMGAIFPLCRISLLRERISPFSKGLEIWLTKRDRGYFAPTFFVDLFPEGKKCWQEIGKEIS